jgi:molecular chaperone GrpE
MVPVRDSLEMALKVEAPTVDSIKEGVEMTLKQLTAAFEKNRLVEVMPQPGDKLDPNKHQAVAVVPSEQEANTVVAVLQKGYMIADRLLRPAIVTAAQPK